MRTTRLITALTALLLALFTFGTALLSSNSGHEWGDDFAGYLTEAIAIANGTLDEQARLNLVMHPSELSFLSDGADSLVYVWGFPLMLVPVYRLLGYDVQTYSTIIYYKLPGMLCLAGLAAVAFLFYRRRFSWLPSVFLTVLLVFSADVFDAAAAITTDLPFLFFSMLSLLLSEVFLDSFRRPAWRRVLLALGLGLSLWAAYVIRLNGITIVLTCLLAAILNAWRTRKERAFASLLPELLPFLIFALCLLVSYQFLPVPTSNVSDLGNVSLSQFFAQIRLHADRLASWVNSLLSGIHDGLLYFGGMHLLLLALGLYGFARVGFPKDLPLFLLAIGTFIGTCLLKYEQGLRYLYICLPLILLFACQGAIRAYRLVLPHMDDLYRRSLRFLSRGVPALIACALLLGSLNQSLALFSTRGQDKPVSDAFSTQAVDMYQYIRQNTPNNATIAFFKPRLLYLNTGRLSFNLQISPSLKTPYNSFLPYQAIRQDVDFADYFLLYLDDTGYQLDIIRQELGNSADELVLIYSNPAFELYQRVR